MDQLFARLKESGHFAWLNTESITKELHWHEEMIKGLSETDILRLFVSPDSIASKWVKQEGKFFLQAGKKVLPILLRQTKAPVALSKIEMIKVQAEGWYHRFEYLKYHPTYPNMMRPCDFILIFCLNLT